MPEQLDPTTIRYALRTAETGRALGVDRRTLDNWRRSGRIRAVVIDGVVLYPISEIRRFLGDPGDGPGAA